MEETLSLLTEYYHHNLEPFLSGLSEDCCWISPAERIIRGAEAIRAEFKEIVMPVCHIKQAELFQLGDSDSGQIIVYGTYIVYADSQAEMLFADYQRVTFCYRKEQEEWRLYHIHVSNLWNELREEEVFPVKISRQTYLYVCRLLEENGKKGKKRLMLKANGGARFIDPDRVLYVEAMGKNSIVHMVDSVLSVNQSISMFEEQLSGHFLRPHRSYLVNCSYVSQIERYVITFITGEQLPIPKQRYTEIRDLLVEQIAAMENENEMKEVYNE